MHLVRRYVICCMTYNLLIKAVHVPGKSNVLADLISRSQVAKLHALAPWLDREPRPVPPIFYRQAERHLSQPTFN